MADLEQEFLCALCSAGKPEQKKAVQVGIRPDMFVGYEAEAMYVWDHFEKYQQFPSLTAVRRTFPQFTLLRASEPVTYYADKMLERETYKGIQKVMAVVNQKLKEQSLSGVNDALKELLSAQELLRKGYSSDQSWDKWDAVRNYLDRERLTTLYTTPYASLNRMIRGARKKNLITLVGRPGIGKTWEMCVWARHFRAQGANVLMVEKEMTADEIYERMDGIEFHLNWMDFLEGRLRVRDVLDLKRRRQAFFAKQKAKFVVSDSEDMEASGLDAVVAKVIEHNPDVLLVDGAYLLDEARQGKSFVEKATLVSRATKRLAKNRNLLVMQSLQLNRKAEEEEKVDLSNIGWSDAYGQDSDYVFCLRGDKREPVRILELLKGRTIASGGMGEFYVNYIFSPHLDFSEVTAPTAKCVKVSTVEG